MAKMLHQEAKEEIAKRLQITRLALGHATQAAFCRVLGVVTPQRWNNYESGRDRLTLNLALAMRRKFPQVTLDWLFCGDKSGLRSAFSTVIDDEEKRIERMSR